jgi:hypothetical protein
MESEKGVTILSRHATQHTPSAKLNQLRCISETEDRLPCASYCRLALPLPFSSPSPSLLHSLEGEGDGGGKGDAILPKKNEGEEVDSLLFHFEATFQEGR